MSENATMVCAIAIACVPFFGLLCWLQYGRGKTCHEATVEDDGLSGSFLPMGTQDGKIVGIHVFGARKEQ